MIKSLKSRVEGIALEIFLPEAPLFSVIYCNGFPGSTGSNELIEYLNAQRVCVIFPQYPGVYDSDGLFTVASASNSIVQVAKFVSEKRLTNIKNDRTIDGIPRVTSIFSHSFGSVIANRACGLIEDLRSVVMLAPIISYQRVPVDYGVREDGLNQLDYVKRSRPYTYRFGSTDDWERLFSGESLDLPEDRYYPKIILGIVGKKDSEFDIPVLMECFQNIIPFQHQTAECRLILVEDASHARQQMLESQIVKDSIEWALGRA